MPSLVEIGQVVLEKRIFNFVNVFSLFRNYLPLKGWGPLFEQSRIPFTQGCSVPSLVEIGSVVLEKIFSISSMYMMYFLLFRNYLPLKGPALYLNKLESPSPKGALCQVWLKLAQWFWRRILCKWTYVQEILIQYFLGFLPLLTWFCYRIRRCIQQLD